MFYDSSLKKENVSIFNIFFLGYTSVYVGFGQMISYRFPFFSLSFKAYFLLSIPGHALFPCYVLQLLH